MVNERRIKVLCYDVGREVRAVAAAVETAIAGLNRAMLLLKKVESTPVVP